MGVVYCAGDWPENVGGGESQSLKTGLRGTMESTTSFAEAITKSDPSDQPSPGDSITKGQKNTHDWEVSKRS